MQRPTRSWTSSSGAPWTTRSGPASAAATPIGGRSWAAAPASPLDEERTRPRIVKVKRFDIEPMFEEDAVERMEELEHSFYVFVNAETERLAVLYKRTDGDYGLIEPEAGVSYAKGQRAHAPRPDPTGSRPRSTRPPVASVAGGRLQRGPALLRQQPVDAAARGSM